MRDKWNHIATCGHGIRNGISTSVREYSGAKELVYGTYCHKCVERYYEEGLLENRELKLIFNKIKRLERMIMESEND